MTLVPPHDLGAEAAVIASALLSRDALDRVLPILVPDQFYSEANRRIFEAAVALSSAGSPVDIVTIRSWLKDRELLSRVGGAAYLAEVLDKTPSVVDVETYARMVRAKHRARQMILTAHRVAAEGYSATDVPEYLDASERAVCDVNAGRDGRQPEMISTVIRDRFIALQSRTEAGTTNMIRTGLDDVDRIIVGFQAPDLVCVAARPGRGKTAFAINNIAASTAARGIGVAVFSLEMSREQLTDRMICSEALVDSRKIPTGTLTAEEWARLAESAARISKLPIVVDDEGAIQLTALRAKARRMATELRRAGTPLGLVVVDYLQLMGTSAGKETRDQKVGENSRGLKALAKELGVVVLMLAQLNRDVEKRGKTARPQLSDLRESGSIEADCDVVLFLHSQDKPDGTAEIIAGKHRQFGVGSAKVAWRPKYTRFDRLESEPAGEEEDSRW